ncbi:MAG: response regulator transcription factor [Dongiaceae bacterium]
MRLLVVEDNERLAGFIAKALRAEGFTVDLVTLLDEAQAALSTTRYDGVVLDLGLPDGDGMRLLTDLRGRGDATPILILTARDGLTDRVQGLNSGADDYLLKPFAMAELVARLRALMRRPGGALGLRLQSGNVTLDTVGSVVEVGGRPLLLSRREFNLLELLLRRAGRVVSKAAIEETLYGYGEEVESNSVEVHMSRLRKKLAGAEAQFEIHTIRGVGYFVPEEKR